MRFQITIVLCLGLIQGIICRSLRIVGGSPTTISDYPFMVSIRYFENNSIFCAGSIISHWNILTSAHCLRHLNNNYSKVRIYAGTKSSRDFNATIFKIVDVKFHPEFLKAMRQSITVRYDIAIVKVDKRIEYNEFQRNIELPTRDVFTGNLAVIVGWGVTNYPGGVTSDVLQKAPMGIYHSSYCNSRHPISIYDDQLCAFNREGMGSCKGDSGGPVINDGKIIGVISLSYGCAFGIPDVHTKVYSFLSFIQSNIEN